MVAGKHWSAVENFLYAKSFVQASENCEKGAGRNKTMFETDVCGGFKILCDGPVRNALYSITI